MINPITIIKNNLIIGTIKGLWYNTMAGSNIKNPLYDTFLITNIKTEKYGYSAILYPSYGQSINDLDKNYQKIKTGMKCRKIMYQEADDSSYIRLQLITKELDTKDFEPIKLKPYELYIGNAPNGKPVIVNMNKSPNLLVAGKVGTGKSRAVFVALTNLIYNYNKNRVLLYLAQIRKHDIDVFNGYENTVKLAHTMEESMDMFKEIEELSIEREALFHKTGVINIEEYNKKFKDTMPYVYLYVDEFKFYMPDAADDKDEKVYKAKFKAKLEDIILAARSSGIFLIAGVQRPDSHSFPSVAKAQMTRVSFKQDDQTNSEIILGNSLAVGLKEREGVAALFEYTYFKTPTITPEIMNKYISHRKLKQQIRLEYKKLTKEELDLLPDITVKEIKKRGKGRVKK